MAEGGSSNNVKDLTKIVLCKNCNKQCLEKEATGKKKDLQSVHCEECGDHYHKMCTDISNKEWDMVTGDNESILFKCPRCIVNKGKKFQEINELKQEIGDIKKEMADLKTIILQNNQQQNQNHNNLIQQLKETMFPEIEKIIDRKLTEHNENTVKKFEERLVNIEAKIEQGINQETESGPLVTAQNAQAQRDIESTIKTQLTESLDEMKDIEERKNNMIIFNIQESNAENDEANQQEDLTKIKEILSHSNPDLTDSEIKNLDETSFTRMGREKSADVNSKPRPIKLTLSSQKIKYQILKNSHKMKTCEKHKGIGYKMDLTKKQQSEEKVLRLKLEERKKTEDVVIHKRQIILRTELEEIRKREQERKARNDKKKADKGSPNKQGGNTNQQ